MNEKNFSCSIQNLKIMHYKSNLINDNGAITSTSPLKSKNISSIKPKAYAYTNKKIKIKLAPFSTNNGFTSPNNRYYNIYKTIFNKTDLSKTKNLKKIFPKISLSRDKGKFHKSNKSEKNDIMYSSIFKMIKTSQNKCNIKKDNLFFMKEKKSEIQNIHKNIMKNNQIHIMSRQNNELNNNFEKLDNNKECNSKFSYISLTEENKICFENEYKNICKNKIKAKNLIEREIKDIGRQFSWVKKLKGKEIEIGENNKKGIDNNNNNEIKNNLLNSLILRRMKGRDPVLEINQASNFPVIAVDKKLLSNLWKKDMIKYCKYTLDIEKPKDKRFLTNLLDVYD